MNHQAQIQKQKTGNATSKAGVEKRKNEREAAFKKIWRGTHKDYRGCLPDGTLTVISWAKYGGGLVTAASICDAELAERSVLRFGQLNHQIKQG
ncbi:hypothetical protein SAMN05216339_101415 [Nitrosomonas eutropha]|uniref:Uncharacterized protein n=1 Tax=Nitrosomonas eutropha TaxID=916 RepID=A0A1I7FCQ3_9PROT|nr:hypothetical protein [Nitrosomonas eutropha]SFU33895.1 hypothetical protein SAMN05216339_101415 [Nitrosomonas eutropha]